jgi:hypothetical protein
VKSATPGSGTSAAEVTNVSPHGIWILVDEREHFLSFREFPWFAQSTIAELTRVERPHPHHLYWPDLDVDLHVDSLVDPGAYPLVSKGNSVHEPRPAAPRRRRRK